ncbi:MAG: hypothetical protein ACKVUT_09415 [Gaiella sp.]
MRPFKFRLETVSRLRDHAERDARDRLARELVAREASAAELERRADALRAARCAARTAAAGTLASWQVLIERREREHEVAVAHLEKHERTVLERQAHLAVASRERDAISKLETRHRAEHLRAVARAEDAILGDVAVAGYHRAEKAA